MYTASHDLKQPVNNLTGVFEELKRTATFHDPDAQQLMGMFEHDLAQINTTIHGLTEVVQVERRSAHSPAEDVELRPLVQGVLQSMQRQASELEADFQVDFAAVPVLHFARLGLQSIFYNLLQNALKYHQPGRPPVVRVATELTDTGTLLVVEDNGLGLDTARYGAELFQMFRRFHSHTPGSGIGLYLVNRLVQQAGGHMEAAGVVGVGTVFRIFLPADVLPRTSSAS